MPIKHYSIFGIICFREALLFHPTPKLQHGSHSCPPTTCTRSIIGLPSQLMLMPFQSMNRCRLIRNKNLPQKKQGSFLFLTLPEGSFSDISIFDISPSSLTCLVSSTSNDSWICSSIFCSKIDPGTIALIGLCYRLSPSQICQDFPRHYLQMEKRLSRLMSSPLKVASVCV